MEERSTHMIQSSEQMYADELIAFGLVTLVLRTLEIRIISSKASESPITGNQKTFVHISQASNENLQLGKGLLETFPLKASGLSFPKCTRTKVGRTESRAFSALETLMPVPGIQDTGVSGMKHTPPNSPPHTLSRPSA